MSVSVINKKYQRPIPNKGLESAWRNDVIYGVAIAEGSITIPAKDNCSIFITALYVKPGADSILSVLDGTIEIVRTSLLAASGTKEFDIHESVAIRSVDGNALKITFDGVHTGDISVIACYV